MKDKIIKLVDDNDIISFDIFDTLLFRNIYQPTDIFKILSDQVLKMYNIENFYNIRIESEARSREYALNGESSFDDIYKEIAKIIGNDRINRIKEMEFDLELEFIDQNPFMKQIFDYSIKKKKQVVLISDMYLTRNQIKKLLKKAGYNVDVPIFVSSECKKNKGSMTLYEEAYNKLKLSKSKWIHIGDNEYSDYSQAINFGIKAYSYKNVRTYDNTIVPNTIEESIILGIQNNYLYNGNDNKYWNKFGIKYISPIYFGFALWLYNLTKEKDNLYFLARDGYIIKKVYDKIVANKKNDNKPKTNYIYCSRRSLQLPNLITKSMDDYMNFLVSKNEKFNYNIAIKDIFDIFSLNADLYKEELELFGLSSDPEYIIKTEEEFHKIKKMLVYISSDWINRIEKDRELAIKYLFQEGMDKYDTLNIVDIGWGGSTQYAISDLLNKKVNGYYFGTIITEGKNNFLSNTFGYYFDCNIPEDNKEKVLDNVMMYELIFSAPHGSTQGYNKKRSKIEPILENNDNLSEQINLFQESALNIIDKYLKYIKYFKFISSSFAVLQYSKFIEQKNFEDLQQFSKLSNDCAIGINEKIQYVKVYDKDYIINNYPEFQKSIEKNLWRGTYLIDDCFTEKEQDFAMIEITKKIKYNLIKNKLNKKDLFNLIKHPINTLKKIKRILFN